MVINVTRLELEYAEKKAREEELHKLRVKHEKELFRLKVELLNKKISLLDVIFRLISPFFYRFTSFKQHFLFLFMLP